MSDPGVRFRVQGLMLKGRFGLLMGLLFQGLGFQVVQGSGELRATL